MCTVKSLPEVMIEVKTITAYRPIPWFNSDPRCSAVSCAMRDYYEHFKCAHFQLYLQIKWLVTVHNLSEPLIALTSVPLVTSPSFKTSAVTLASTMLS